MVLPGADARAKAVTFLVITLLHIACLQKTAKEADHLNLLNLSVLKKNILLAKAKVGAITVHHSFSLRCVQPQARLGTSIEMVIG